MDKSLEEKKQIPQKYDMKIVFGIFFILLLLYSASTKFVTITIDNEVWMSKYMYEVIGVEVTIVAAIIYLYSLFSKKKAITYFSLILLIGSFFYSAYTYYNVETVVTGIGEFVKDHTEYGDGVLFYIISYILLLISVFIPSKGNSQNKILLPKELEQYKEIEGQYLLANYIYGLTNRPDLFKKFCIIIAKDEEPNVDIIIQSENNEKVTIPKTSITKITSKLGVITHEDYKINESETARQFFDIAMVGHFNATLLAMGRDKRIDTYYKVNFSKVYDIEFLYTEQGISKKIMIQTKENPTEFLKKFGDIYIATNEVK